MTTFTVTCPCCNEEIELALSATPLPMATAARTSFHTVGPRGPSARSRRAETLLHEAILRHPGRYTMSGTFGVWECRHELGAQLAAMAGRDALQGAVKRLVEQGRLTRDQGTGKLTAREK
jgi:hypothetical protein